MVAFCYISNLFCESTLNVAKTPVSVVYMFFYEFMYYIYILVRYTVDLKIKIYRTIILPVVLYGCETWSPTFREEHRLRVFRTGC